MRHRMRDTGPAHRTQTHTRTDTHDLGGGPDRRSFLRGASGLLTAAVSVTVLAGCGADEVDAARDAASSLASLSGEAQQAVTEAVRGAGIPVGGAQFLPAVDLVVTRPGAGDYRVMSTVCTHQGGVVDRIEDGRLVCPLHGSRFDAATGEAVVGPASQPLAVRSVDVEGGSVSFG